MAEPPTTMASVPPPADLISPRLAALIARLETVQPGDTTALARALESELSFDDIRTFVQFGAESYRRNLVFKTDKVELRLLCWRPGQASSFHGHGNAACAFRVMRGVASEIVLGERDRSWAPGAVIEERGKRVHQVMNLGKDPLLTLNAYSPPLPVDRPSPLSGHQVVIVGGGFSGIAAAYHLLKEGGPDLRIHVVEMGPWLGRGIAYGVESDVFRLNVPASRMSIDPGQPDDFVKFASAEDRPNAFLARATYGEYVVARLHGAIRSAKAKIRVWRDEAVAVTPTHVALRSGLQLEAKAVVLATGLVPRVVKTLFDPRVIDAWDECALSTLPRHGRIALVGSGLSALDVVAFLEAQRFEGHVTLVSPRGLLPFAHHASGHAGARKVEDEQLQKAPRELRALMRWIRRHIEDTVAAGQPWQCAMDGIRPHVASLYRSLSPRDRVRFVRHVRPYWDVLRHRAPAESIERVDAWERAGRLTRIAGRLTFEKTAGPRVAVMIHRRNGQATAAELDAVVRCVGPALRFAEAETPLLKSLLDSGLARDAHGLGLETDATGRVVDATGETSDRVFAIGSLQRASHWETTAVPDIAPHAQAIARLILRGGA
jgi:uncharacterized NAD(P)/FAD-binding protein YdhS